MEKKENNNVYIYEDLTLFHDYFVNRIIHEKLQKIKYLKTVDFASSYCEIDEQFEGKQISRLNSIFEFSLSLSVRLSKF